MAYENSLMTELMVPRDPVVSGRIEGFYEAIEWDVRKATDSKYFTYVNPNISRGVPPTLGYWQTENPNKIAHFDTNKGIEPTIFAHGLRLPQLHELVEVCLVVPTDEDVHTIFERGGRVLDRHAHIKPRDHAGSQEFRFSDPFNYSLRVTTNPGWEIALASDRKVAETSLGVEYNPKYVVWVYDETAGDDIPIITNNNMKVFEKDHKGSNHQSERLMNCLLRQHNLGNGMRPYVTLTPDGHAIGLRLDKARTALELLKSGAIKLTNLGTKGMELLEQYCDEVIPLPSADAASGN